MAKTKTICRRATGCWYQAIPRFSIVTFFKAHGIEGAQLRPSLRPWTDDYSNLFHILK